MWDRVAELLSLPGAFYPYLENSKFKRLEAKKELAIAEAELDLLKKKSDDLQLDRYGFSGKLF